MPKSKVRKKTVYTPPAGEGRSRTPVKVAGPTHPVYIAVMLGLMLLGLVWLVVNYIAAEKIPFMLELGGGAIVNTSSGAGVAGFAGQAAYSAAKHGVIGLTKAAALDYAPSNIRVNAVCPGIVQTEMMQRFSGGTAEGEARVIGQEPIGRMGRPEEIAAAVVWLASDQASFLVGHAMVVDGGQTA